MPDIEYKPAPDAIEAANAKDLVPNFECQNGAGPGACPEREGASCK